MPRLMFSSLGLARDGKLVVSVDHRFALSNPALVSAPSKKSFSSVNCPDLGVQRLEVHRRLAGRRRATEHSAARSSNCRPIR